MTSRTPGTAWVEDRWTRVVAGKKVPAANHGKGKRWRARWVDDEGRERAASFDRKVDAQRKVDAVTASLVRGDYVDPRRGEVTFREWWGTWVGRQTWVKGTHEAAERTLACLTFADVRIGRVDEGHVAAWVKAMSQPVDGSRPLAPSTLKVRFALVRMAFKAAVRSGLISKDPTADVRTPKGRRREVAMEIPTPSQVGQALEAAPEHFRAFVAVCAFAGLRLGEAAGLQVDDVDFLRRTITVRRQVQGSTVAGSEVVPPKAGSERVVYVPDALLQLLSAHIEAFGVRGDERWLLHNAGDLWNRGSAGQAWRTTRTRAALGDFTLHDLRHFYASALIADGCDVVTVQRALGHSSATITLGTYSHLWPTAEDKTRAAAGRLAAQVLGAGVSPRLSGVSS